MIKKNYFLVFFIFILFSIFGVGVSLLCQKRIYTWTAFWGTTSYDGFVYPFFSLIIVSSILSVICLIYYYCKKEKAIKKHDDMMYRIGYDITRLLSWPFSANGLLFLITFATISLIAFVMITHGDSNTGNLPTPNVSIGSVITGSEGSGDFQLVAITLSITLATIIPFIISKIAAKGELEDLIEKRQNQFLGKFNTSIMKILKTNAHENRMSAVFLYQIAEQRKMAGDYESTLRNVNWSLGWAAKAIKEYLLIKDSYSNAIKFSEDILRDYLLEYKTCITQCEKELSYDEFQKAVRSRDLISLFTIHALIRKFNVLRKVKINDDYINVEKELTEIEGTLLYYIDKNDFNSSKDFNISEDTEFNEELERTAEILINKAIKVAEQTHRIKEREVATKKAQEELYKKEKEESYKRVQAII